MPTDAEKHVWENEDGDLVVVLDLPAGPREYVIADVSTRTGRYIARLTEGAARAKQRVDAGEDVEDVAGDLHLDDESEIQLYERVLGKTYDELEEDDVPNRTSKWVGQIAYLWVAAGLKAARNAWEAGPQGAPKANRAQRRATSRASGSKTKAAGASATTTRPRASTKATKPRS